MHFLTEDDAKKRCESGEIRLSADERLTPAALEMLHGQGCRIVSSDASPAVLTCTAAGMPAAKPSMPVANASSTPVTNASSMSMTNASSAALPNASSAPQAIPASAAPATATPPPTHGALPQGTTYLDASTVVNKSHPRIMLRGKLDSLIAACVVVQTQFDMRKSLPELVITGLADLNTSLWYLLQTEITAAPLPGVHVCGMDADTLRTVSLNPKHYLGLEHIIPSGSLGPNVALLNWLRTLTREVEVVCTEVSPDRIDMLEGLNRLSTAVYVLMLLVVLAESGQALPKVPTS